ncbi:MAG: UDP-glucose 4-epimerase GalE [Geminicoccaceae bacterium]
MIRPIPSAEPRARVLVTGGAGYVGSHTCKALYAAGFDPISYDNLSSGNRWAVRWGALEVGDILDVARLARVMTACRPAAVIHFAAKALVGESMRSPDLYWQINTAGSLALLQAMQVANVDVIVFSSTSAVYGVPSSTPIDEESSKSPANAYGASKLAAERMILDFAHAYNLKWACLRYFNAAGADPDGEIGEARAVETHIIPLALDAALGVGPPITVFGSDYPTPDGTAVRDYVHVSDLADAHVSAVRHLLAGGASLELNLGTGEGHSVAEVLDTIERVTNKPVPRRAGCRRLGDPPELVANPRRAQRVLGFEPKRSRLDTIVRDAWRWRVSTAGAWRQQPAGDQHARHAMIAPSPGAGAIPNGVPARFADRVGTPS